MTILLSSVSLKIIKINMKGKNMYLIIREIEYDTFENDYSVLGSAKDIESANKLLDAHKLIDKRENTNFSIVKFETPLILKKEVANG